MEKCKEINDSTAPGVAQKDNIVIRINTETENEYFDGDIAAEDGVYNMVYFGSTTVDRRYSAAVMPWVVRQLKTDNKGKEVDVQVIVKADSILVTQEEANDKKSFRRVLDTHSFDTILKLARLKMMDKYVGFLTVPIRDSASSTCHIFEAENSSVKCEFLKSLRYKILNYQATASDSPKKALVNALPTRPTHRRNLSSGAVLNKSHQDTVHRFSVYYVGKVTITQPHAPPKLVDEILRDLKRLSLQEKSRDKMTNSTEEANDLDGEAPKPIVNDDVEPHTSNTQLAPDSPDRRRSSSDGDQHKPDPIATNGSKFHEPSLAEIQEDVKSRLVTFQISMSSLMLFNYGSKTLLLERKIRDISYCTKAETNPDHFGFVCRENSQHTLYTFQGESESVVDTIMKAMRQAFTDALQASAHLTLCDSCPLHHLLKLCGKLEESSYQNQHAAIQECVHQLTDAEDIFFMNTLNKLKPTNDTERIEISVGLLRDIFDQRQKQHKHSQRTVPGDANVIVVPTVEEGRERSRSTRFEKYKKVFTNSFDNLWTRRGKPKSSSNPNDRSSPLTVETGRPFPPGTKCLSPVLMPKPLLPEAIETRPRSRTYNSCPPTPTSLHTNQKFVIPENGVAKAQGSLVKPLVEKDPMETKIEERTEEVKSVSLVKAAASPDIKALRAPKRQGSWRQAIYDSVVTPPSSGSSESPTSELVFRAADPSDDRNPSERARSRWQKAIKEQILLIRMEKENKKLAASLVATETRRLKLSYDDHGKCTAEAVILWDGLLSGDSKDRVDDNVLLKAVRTGVPKVRRGEIWQFLIHQHAIRTPDSDDEAWMEANYHDLVDEPTSHQHAILIDLGRTFPSHKYFTSVLGSGQISLFNILKAYSLLDTEVGYCQGLSFVAGLLLMHMSEEESFECFRHIMFKLGIRNQYKPDMNAVQQQLYQLSRLLHDYHPSVYDHLNKHDVTPTLYAAPWFLTLFASQYPVGFVSRVMDLLFFQGIEVIFKVALVIIGLHTEEILDCDGFENVVDYLKLSLPEKVKAKADEIISRALDMDIKQQLNLYEVEYQLLHEEMIDIRQNRERFERQESTNRELSDQVDSLKDELQKANETIKLLKQALTDSLNRNKLMEVKLTNLRRERDGVVNLAESAENSSVSSPVSEVERILSSDKPDGYSMEKSWEMVPSPTTVISQMDLCLDRVQSFDDSEPISRSNSDECCDSEEVSKNIAEACGEQSAISDISTALPSIGNCVSEVNKITGTRRKSFPQCCE